MKKPVTVNKKRWAMYAAAGAAAVITGAEAAEAQDVTHVVVGEGAGGSVGILNELTFELGDTGDFLALTNSAGYYAADPNVQTAGILDANGDDTGGIAAAILPSQFGPFNAVYGANLASGVALSELPSAGVNQTGFQSQVGVPLIYGTPSANTSFSAGGDNFIGFVFDGGNEFGWARVTFDDVGGTNTVVLEEYAFSVDGATIAVGQTEFVGVRGGGGTPAIPEPTSLGLLALGAIGVLANRRRKLVA